MTISLDRIRNSIYEFGRGVDTREENLGDASGVALRFRFSDLDMDCNILESEFQSSIEHMLWFINHHLFITGQGDYKELLDCVGDGDLHTKLANIEYSTSLREIVTIETMINYRELEESAEVSV